MPAMATDLLAIRNGRLADAPEIAATYEEAWRATYQGVIPHLALERMIARRGSRWWQRALERRAGVLVLEFDGETVGYTSFGRSRMRHTPYGGEIYELYVRPTYQGVGFGARLFRAARRRLCERELTGLVIWSLADNDRACTFYLAMGGRPISEGAESFGGVTLRKVAFAWS